MKKWCILIDQTKTDLTTPHQEFWQKKKKKREDEKNQFGSNLIL